MIAIKDIDMPNCCMNCELLGKEEMYCTIYPRRDLDIITVTTNRPNWCSLVEIITCKDCKYYRNNGKYSYCTKRLNVDSVTDRYREPNFYCADAERRD